MEDCAGMQLRLCDSLKQIDFLINVPVLKGHCQTKITCALKNLKGVIPIPRSEIPYPGASPAHRPSGSRRAAGFYRGGSYLRGLRLRGRRESGGAQLYHGGQRSGLMDSYVCRLLHYDVSEVPYVVLAGQLGVGSTDLSRAQIRVIGEEEKEELPRRRKWWRCSMRWKRWIPAAPAMPT